ncbi:MCE family protein [bacterium]|nr:MCE family protein [bacterium]
METRANYVLIGAFVLVAAAAAMLFTVWISGGQFNRSKNVYDVVFQGAVNGLSEGGEVRFNGIKVGEVSRLSLDQADSKRVIARIQIDSRTPVRTDSVATLEFLGITGVTFIQLSGGSADKPLLTQPLGAPPPIIQAQTTIIDELFQGGQNLLSVSGETLQSLNEVLAPDNIVAVRTILANLATASEKLSADDGLIDSATSALQSVDRAARSLDRAAASLDVAVNDINASVAKLSDGSEEVLSQAGPLLAETRTSLKRLDSAVEQLDAEVIPGAGRALEQLALSASDVSATLLRLQALAAQIEQDPSAFVFPQPQPVERR